MGRFFTALFGPCPRGALLGPAGTERTMSRRGPSIGTVAQVGGHRSHPARPRSCGRPGFPSSVNQFRGCHRWVTGRCPAGRSGQRAAGRPPPPPARKWVVRGRFQFTAVDVPSAFRFLQRMVDRSVGVWSRSAPDSATPTQTRPRPGGTAWTRCNAPATARVMDHSYPQFLKDSSIRHMMGRQPVVPPLATGGEAGCVGPIRGGGLR